MKKITVSASGTYEVCIGAGLLEQVGALSAPLLKGRGAVILSDSHVWPLYGQRVQESLEDAGFTVKHFVFPAGERSKTPETLLNFITFLAQNQLTRSDAVFALGGGVTGDLGGLAAALYLRGLPCVQLPTSLLAMVDSSVGGKTAVDLPEGKNLMGTFTQPKLVLCDPLALETLDPAVRAEGWAEIIKYGMLGSADLLDTLEAGEEQVDIEEIIAHCVAMKRDVVASDEQDQGARQILNFGHTIGHAIERCGGYRFYHGEGVAMGMAIMTRACVKLGRCPAACEEILERLLMRYHLPNNCPMGRVELLDAARADKKRRGDAITLIQPETVGRCVLRRTDYAELNQILRLGMEP